MLLPEHVWRLRDASADWRPDPILGWVQKANLDVTTRGADGRLVHFRTNADGLQPATARRTRRPGRPRILLVGDSTVVGRAVPAEQRLHAHPTRALGRRVEVLNAAVEGYATDQALLRLEALLPLYHPDIVIYGLCENDFPGNASDRAHGFGKPRFALQADRLDLVPPPALRRREEGAWGSGPRRWLQHSALYRALQPNIWWLRSRVGGWERTLLGLAPEIYYRPRALEEFDWALFAALVGRMRAAAARHGALLLIYSHPSLAEVWDPTIRSTERRLALPPGVYDRFALQRRLTGIAGKVGFSFCPMIEHFVASRAAVPFHLLPRDPHCNGTGYLLTAEALAG